MIDIFDAIKKKNLIVLKDLIDEDNNILNEYIPISNALSGGGPDDGERKYSLSREGVKTEDYTIDHSPAFYTILQIYAENYKDTSIPSYKMARFNMSEKYLEYRDEIKGNYRDILKNIIENMNRSKINETYSDTGKTLLHYLGDDSEFRKLLIEKGADRLIKDKYGLTALDHLKAPYFCSKIGSSIIGLGIWVLNQDTKFYMNSIIENSAILLLVTLGAAIAKAIDIYIKAKSLNYNRSESLYESLKVIGIETLKYSSAIASGSIGAIIIGAFTANPLIASMSVIASSVVGSHLICDKSIPFVQKIINERQNKKEEYITA